VGQQSLIVTQDGSATLFSQQYQQHYHNINDGALNEALHKHVLPALKFHQNKSHLRILDICFGLGYNTFATLYTLLEQNLPQSVEIFTPELDENLIHSLKNFQYPKEFESLQPIIKELLSTKKYKSKRFSIELFIGNAREYVQTLSNIDIVYQDAFSSDVNPKLWTMEYFKDIFKACNDEAIITTYSIATPVRLSLHEAGFLIYEYKLPNNKKATLAFKQPQSTLGKHINMHLKQQRNPNAKPLCDKN
jgi:tRNA U34 5-methylaminomethyl-2-thiouridine-forming methyltransferase MnmC